MLLGVLTLSPLHKQALNFACCLAPDVLGSGAGQGGGDVFITGLAQCCQPAPANI